MAQITDQHFGGNLVWRNDTAGTKDSSAYDAYSQSQFSYIRFPGGTVTEKATWENGDMQRIFSKTADPNGAMTMREAFDLAREQQIEISIVIPTVPFKKADGSLDQAGFSRYLGELKVVIKEYPDVKVQSFEIGNEHWAQFTGFTGKTYGQFADKMIPQLDKLNKDIAKELNNGWSEADIGIQAGAQWRASGVNESKDIANAISMENRALVDTIFQHSYENPENSAQYTDRVIKPMEVFQGTAGYKANLNFNLSEFNMDNDKTHGNQQASTLIESFGRMIDRGADQIAVWGVDYKNLSNKLYDTSLSNEDLASGVTTIATPTGLVYNMARENLVGKLTMSDQQALAGIKGVANDSIVTGFHDDGQRIVFAYNESKDQKIDLSAHAGKHITWQVITEVDDSSTANRNELDLMPNGLWDSRGDMKITAGTDAPRELTIKAGQMVMISISDPDYNLTITGTRTTSDKTKSINDDVIKGANGNDIIKAGAGNDEIRGGGGKNYLDGGDGNDRIYAGDNGDILIAGRGNDYLYGGKGHDIFFLGEGQNQVRTGEGHDGINLGAGISGVVEDFNLADILVFNGLFEDKAAFNKAVSIDGEDLLISTGENSTLRLVGAKDLKGSVANRVADFNEKLQQNLEDRALGGMTLDQLDELYKNELGEQWSDREDLEDRIEVGDDNAKPTPPPVAPPPEEKDDEEDKEDKDSGGGSCFVATAAYADPSHPEVVAMRRIRDDVLVRSAIGRAFVRFYWRVGPHLARSAKSGGFVAKTVRGIVSFLTSK